MAENWLASYGERLIANGYKILPLPAKMKRPVIEDWQNINARPEHVKGWVDQGFSGIGILCRDTPAIDIDIRDERIAKKVEDFCLAEFGAALCRVGRAPKRLLLFRATSPFSKFMSPLYEDENGDQHRIEVLGVGQQFVAYNIHPETQKPFEWQHGTDPTMIPASELPVLSVEQIDQLFEYLESIKPSDWQVVKHAARGMHALTSNADRFSNMAPRVGLTIGEVREYLNDLPTDPWATEYDAWAKLGMMLHHETQGSDEGFELYDEFSQRGGGSYEGHDDTRKKWDSFNVAGPTGTLTFRTVMAEALKVRQGREMHELKASINGESDYNKLLKKHLRDVAVAKAITDHDRTLLLDKLRIRVGELSGKAPSLTELKKLAKQAERDEDAEVNPAVTDGLQIVADEWKDFYFELRNNCFFSFRNDIQYSRQAFDAKFSRHFATETMRRTYQVTPIKASEIALSEFENGFTPVTIVDSRRYAPGEPRYFERAGTTYANTYVDHRPKPMEPAIGSIHDQDLQRVQRHFEVLIENRDEREILISWIAHVVTEPGVPVGWAVLLQGGQGIGKSILGVMIKQLLGRDNVGLVNAQDLEQQYTPWATGNCLNCVEEVKLHGQNRFEVVNRLKPYISNDEVVVSQKYEKSYKTPNTTSYLMFTNYRDAMPVDDEDRRYLTLMSRYQKLSEFEAEVLAKDPDYFTKLLLAFERSAGAIRWWLETRAPHPKFRVGGKAPRTSASSMIAEITQDEDEAKIQDLADSGTFWFLTPNIVDLTALNEAIGSPFHKLSFKRSRINSVFVSLGYVPFGDKDSRVMVDRKIHRVYVKQNTDEAKWGSKRIAEWIRSGTAGKDDLLE